MKELLHSERKPEAIYVMAPEKVLGVLGACKEAGLSVPGDMEILAYGDSDAFDCFSPTVSSNYISMQEVAESAQKKFSKFVQRMDYLKMQIYAGLMISWDLFMK